MKTQLLIILCCFVALRVIFWHNMNPLDKVNIVMISKFVNVSMQLVETYIYT